MTFWTLIRYAPAIIALWQRMGGTPFNDLATWGGLIAEAVAVIARMGGVDVPPLADVIATGTAGAGAVHKTSVAKDNGFSADDFWQKQQDESP